MKEGKNFFYIPAGIPVAAVIAKGLLEEHAGEPEGLGSIRILLPTRRACRAQREAFLRYSGGKALILPRMQPVGDVDEEELELLSADYLSSSLPPAISPLERQILLARLIAGREDFRARMHQAFALAGELGRFLDQLYIEELSFDQLTRLVPEEFSEHWQITIRFLEIIGENWPKILESRGVIDAAERRSRLIRALGESWRDNPPAERIIAAGSTGSIPATADLLGIVAGLPRGELVLPGLDTELDEESWRQLDETHPQFMLRRLLERSGIGRQDVRLWHGAEFFDCCRNRGRELIAREIMRPAATTYLWQGCRLEGGLEGVRRYDCRNQQEEAAVIALHLREALERRPDFTAALVTPDRRLARRVAMACTRWGIRLDDSGGCQLGDTQAGSFFRLLAECVNSGLAPTRLLGLLKHKLAGGGLAMRAADYRMAVRLLDKETLRGLRPVGGFEGIRSRFLPDHTAVLIDQIEPILMPSLRLAERQRAPFAEWLVAQIEAAERLAGKERLWSGEDGEAAGRFFTEFYSNSSGLPEVSGEDYLAIAGQLMKGVTVRPEYGTHPRLSILGQLEARLADVDLVVLGGLNEKSWPPDTGQDPWMSRPMRLEFGLPAAERRIGQSAHDFMQCFCSGEVVLTRSLKADGAPAVPSRWLQRLDTVMKAAGIKPEVLRGEYQGLAGKLSEAGEPKPYRRPGPVPEVQKRPRTLSVTEIEKLVADPYYIYAKHILRLRKLPPLDKQFEADDRGRLLHKILEKFTLAYPDRLNEGAREDLLRIAREEADKACEDPEAVSVWWPRLARFLDWFAEYEMQWRERARPVKCEIKGAHRFVLPAGEFELRGIADRIDLYRDRGAAIIDYKCGGSFTQKSIKDTSSPQLPLEAWLLAKGAFPGIPQGAQPRALFYLIMSGGSEPGKCVGSGEDCAAELAEKAGEGLIKLLSAFDDKATPYLAIPDPERAPRFNDYEHLERVKEWAALGDNGEADIDP